jgi:hypothetical protein
MTRPGSTPTAEQDSTSDQVFELAGAPIYGSADFGAAAPPADRMLLVCFLLVSVGLVVVLLPRLRTGRA